MSDRPSLQSLAEKYGCDKLYNHSYIPWYEKLFKDMVVMNLLEIVIGFEELMRPFVPKYVHGASLKMWRDYFHGAWIHGCDRRHDTMFDDEGISTAVIDQSWPQDLWKLCHIPWDVIIDDGSHVTADRLLSAAVLVPHLRPGGLYVIEDVEEPYPLIAQLGGEVLNGNKRSDDCLVVIRR